jgi:hypothetical protein
LRSKTLVNDFEASVFGLEPEIACVKKTLLDLGAVQAIDEWQRGIGFRYF